MPHRQLVPSDQRQQIIDRLARSYQSDGVTPEPYVDIPGKPAGALNVTAGDLAKLAQRMVAIAQQFGCSGLVGLSSLGSDD